MKVLNLLLIGIFLFTLFVCGLYIFSDRKVIKEEEEGKIKKSYVANQDISFKVSHLLEIILILNLIVVIDLSRRGMKASPTFLFSSTLFVSVLLILFLSVIFDFNDAEILNLNVFLKDEHSESDDRVFQIVFISSLIIILYNIKSMFTSPQDKLFERLSYVSSQLKKNEAECNLDTPAMQKLNEIYKTDKAYFKPKQLQKLTETASGCK